MQSINVRIEEGKVNIVVDGGLFRNVEAFSIEEMQHILECLKNEPLKWQAYVTLIIDTGCRRGEICGLRWQSVNFKDKTIVPFCTQGGNFGNFFNQFQDEIQKAKIAKGMAFSGVEKTDVSALDAKISDWLKELQNELNL